MEAALDLLNLKDLKIAMVRMEASIMCSIIWSKIDVLIESDSQAAGFSGVSDSRPFSGFVLPSFHL
jgi:hypothetical protein